MAQIIIDIPAGADLTRAVDAYCALYNYQALLPGGGANPETRNQFAKRMVANWIKDTTKEYEATLAATTARNAANSLNIT